MDVKNIKILVIDDEEIMRNCLYDVLSDEGYQVFTATTGEEGLRFIEDNHFNIIFLDIKMQGMSGVEVLKVIKKVDPQIAVVMITGYASVNTAVESMKLGAYDYLTKPFDMEQIKSIIFQVISRLEK